jgi:hypothetical protein
VKAYEIHLFRMVLPKDYTRDIPYTARILDSRPKEQISPIKELIYPGH